MNKAPTTAVLSESHKRRANKFRLSRAFIRERVYDFTDENGPVRYHLELAFVAQTGYLRDWHLFQARDEWNLRETKKQIAAYIRDEAHRVNPVPFPHSALKAYLIFTQGPNTPEDHYFAQAQKHLAGSMAVCVNPICKQPFYFRRKPKQQACCKKCARAGAKRSRDKWETAHGKEWRAAWRKKRRLAAARKTPGQW